MKYFKFLPLVLGFAMLSCGGEEEVDYNEQQPDGIRTVDHDEFLAECQDLEKEILSTPVPDEEKLKEAVTKFQDFAGFFPEDSLSPSYLQKASDFALQVGQPEKSVKILDRIINEYPDYNRMIDVRYSRASHLDYELRDTTRAKKAYQFIIDNYPDDNRALDAQIRIKYIRYNLEEYGMMIANGEIEPLVQ